jgi:metal-responsive CopG/Arc/MetJ family transcriptional regulator
MRVAKVTVSLEAGLVREVDRLVNERVFASRSQAVDLAIKEKLQRIKKSRLKRACALLDPDDEQAFAEIGVTEDLTAWPEY